MNKFFAGYLSQKINLNNTSLQDLVSVFESYSKLSKFIDCFFEYNKKIFDEYEALLLQKVSTNEPISEKQKQRKAEIQKNRIKSNNKKKIAQGRTCAVNCIESGLIIRGFLVVFKYYNIKLYLGPFLNKNIAKEVISDFRKELFKLQITKSNYKSLIGDFYSTFKNTIGSRYKVLTIYHKNNSFKKEMRMDAFYN